MTEKQSRLVNYLFLAALIIALLLRFINLGAAPLSDSEAEWALQALNAADPGGMRSQVTIGANPAYVLLTSLLFAIFGATNFLARFLPALSGLLLVLVPYYMRKNLGVWVAVIAAIGLAIDPGLVTVSRQAGGPMMAVSFGLLALALWIDRRPMPAGIMAGLALLSGTAIYPGLIGLGIALLAFKSRFGSKPETDTQAEAEITIVGEPAPDKTVETSRLDRERRTGLIATGLTILLAGTLFFLYPQGLAAWAQSLADYLAGWTSTPTTSALKMLATLMVYQPFALLFALIGSARLFVQFYRGDTRQKSAVLITIVWLLSMLVLTIVYPGREVSDLIWVLVPLWILAAFELERALPQENPNQVSVFQAILIFILGSLFWISLVSASRLVGFGENSPIGIQLVLLSGILLLGVLSSVLVALGWSAEISRYGATWGAAMLGLIYLISAGWGAAQLHYNQPVELWSPLPGTGQSKLLLDTLTNFSDRNGSLANSIVILSTVDAPSMRWVLRDFPNTRFSDAIPEGDMPEIILTSTEEEPPALAQGYRGQDFVWWTWPGWEGTIPPNKVTWFAFRDAAVTTEKVILWVRGDQFPSGQIGSQENSAILP